MGAEIICLQRAENRGGVLVSTTPFTPSDSAAPQSLGCINNTRSGSMAMEDRDHAGQVCFSAIGWAFPIKPEAVKW